MREFLKFLALGVLIIFIIGCIKSEIPPGKIIFGGQGEEIFEINPNGKNQRIISEPLPSYIISPDGKNVIFGRYKENKNFKIKKFELFLWEINKRKETKLIEMGGDIGGGISFYPDGKKIIFASNQEDKDYEIYEMDIDEPNNIRKLTDNSLDDINPQYSPDGKKVIFEASIYIESIGMIGIRPPYWSSDKNDPINKKLNSAEIYIMDVDGNNVMKLTNNSVEDDAPCWSPNSKKIAFLSDGQLCIMDVEGKNLINLTKDHPKLIKAAGGKDYYQRYHHLSNYSICSPCWSPDGKYISFIFIGGTKNVNIYTINISNKKVRQVTNSFSCGNLAWLPASIGEYGPPKELLNRYGKWYYQNEVIPHLSKFGFTVEGEWKKNFDMDLDNSISNFITKNNIGPYLTIYDKFTFTFKPKTDGHWEIEIFKR